MILLKSINLNLEFHDIIRKKQKLKLLLQK